MQRLLAAADRFPLLTAVQEVELGRAIRAWQDHPDGPDGAPPRIRRSGKRALDRFVCSNIRLAHHIARRYADRGVPIEDLTQAAIEGMINAYRKFRPELGYRSSSYAIWYGRQACQTILASMGQALRLPVHQCDTLNRLIRLRADFIQAHRREPTTAELAKAADMTAEQLREFRELINRARAISLTSIANSRDEEGTFTEAGLDASERPTDCALDALHRHDTWGELADCIDSSSLFTEQQRFILRERYLSDTPMSRMRLGQVLHLSSSLVTRLEDQALGDLRAAMAAETPVAA